MPTSISKEKLKELAIEAILKHFPVNLSWIDINGYLQGCNDQVLKIFGLTQDVLSNTHVLDLFNGSLKECWENSIRIMKENEGVKTLEESYLNPDGSKSVFVSIKSPLHDSNGNVVGLVNIATDITEMKKLQEELRIAKEAAELANKAKTHFLSIVNHELRQPLTGILAMTKFLKEENLPREESDGYIEMLDNCSQHLLSLINDLLDLSKLELGKAKLRPVPLNFKSLIEDVVNILTTLAKIKNLDLHYHYDESVPTYVIGDARALRQILINLINNGIKFTEKGYVSIHVMCQEKTSSRVKLKIAITDTGKGIPENKYQEIFESFHQIEDNLIRPQARMGTGLGLTITKELLKLMDGQVNVESKEGIGSTFYVDVTLPLPNLTQTTIASLSTDGSLAAQHSFKTLSMLKILLIDDDKIVQFAHQKMLSALTRCLDVASTGKEAVEKAKENYDVIFVDISLPDISGYEVMQKIREYEKDKDHKTYLIALTGFTDPEVKHLCLEMGADEVLGKPIAPDELQNVLERSLTLKLDI